MRSKETFSLNHHLHRHPGCWSGCVFAYYTFQQSERRRKKWLKDDQIIQFNVFHYSFTIFYYIVYSQIMKDCNVVYLLRRSGLVRSFVRPNSNKTWKPKRYALYLENVRVPPIEVKGYHYSTKQC
jgi:hypothetical protein